MENYTEKLKKKKVAKLLVQISKGKPQSRDLVLHLVVHNSRDIVIYVS